MKYRNVIVPMILMVAAAAAAVQEAPAPPAPAARPSAVRAPQPPAPPVPAIAPAAPAPVPRVIAMPDVWVDGAPLDLDLKLDALKLDLDRADIERQVSKAMALAQDSMLLAQNRLTTGWRGASGEEGLYQSGQEALENRRWDRALENFNQVSARGGSRADAGWFWKAYTLKKLGRSDEALAALAELRKTYPNSRWLDDAKALELEVKQQAGQKVSPESESDEELKLMAINGLMQSDPERALPLIEKVLKASNPPRVKQRALFVLAQSSSPRAQQALEQIARGGGNPDLQIKAISYLGTLRRRQQGGQTAAPPFLAEVYGASNDANVKRAILNVYMSNRDSERLAQVARTEKNTELRQDAFRYLGNNTGQPELWQIYQSETSSEVREQILQCMYNNGDTAKLAEVARTDKDPKLRRIALRVLATQKAPATADTLVSIYGGEQDQQNKQAVLDSLFAQRNAKALVSLAKAEKDAKLKLRIVERLSMMKDKEAQDYLQEILSR